MNFTGKIAEVLPLPKGLRVALNLTERKDLSKLLDCEVDVEIKKHREARSISANNYAWLLMGKIKNVLGTSDDEVYHIMLTRYGQNRLDENGVVKTFSTQFDLDGYEKIHSAPIGKSELNGKEFIHYRMIKGSSEYDSKEMSEFLNGVVEEAKELDIETKPEAEIKSMMEAWGGK